MSFFRLLSRCVEKIEEYLLAWGILLMFALLSTNAILRTALGMSIIYAEEIGQLSLTLVTFGGLGYVARHGKNIRMSALYDILPHRYQKVFACVVSAVTSATLFWLSWIAFHYMAAIKLTGRATPALRIPVYLPTGVVAAGFLLAALQYLYIFYLNVSKKENFVGAYRGAEDEAY